MRASRKLVPGVLGVMCVGAFLSTAVAQTPKEWFANGRGAVETAKQLRRIDGRAKNVILFVGDGMGLATVTAARILDGQRRGHSGEEHILSFERLPYVALSKTYNTNQQTPDSAGTMTAMMTGVKTRAGVIGVDGDLARGDYASAEAHTVATLLELCETRKMATGIVTTTSVTHATPAACYAHSPERNWQDDSLLSPEARAANFPDIARQLIEFPYGDGVDVVLGGGRWHFLPAPTDGDPAARTDGDRATQTHGMRTDGRDLTREWSDASNTLYVANRAGLAAIDVTKGARVLGLFAPSHMAYEFDRARDTPHQPSLSQMTGKAIDILATMGRKAGFFLMVEGGRIDHAHHEGNAHRALLDTIEFANAVEVAMGKTDPSETLIIVTADHSHVFTMAGYPTRGNPILGKVIGNDMTGKSTGQYSLDALGLPYTTLGYANGPGYTGASSDQPEGAKRRPHSAKGYRPIVVGRPNLSERNTADPCYLQEATVPMGAETHGGEDVPVYAGGPSAHLIHGVMEQNVIFHVMAEALGLSRHEN